MKIYIGIDMANDKLDYCVICDALNILCIGIDKKNKNERFKELSDLIRILNLNSTFFV
jgi:hypothetical protein